MKVDDWVLFYTFDQEAKWGDELFEHTATIGQLVHSWTGSEGKVIETWDIKWTPIAKMFLPGSLGYDYAMGIPVNHIKPARHMNFLFGYDTLVHEYLNYALYGTAIILVVVKW